MKKNYNYTLAALTALFSAMTAAQKLPVAHLKSHVKQGAMMKNSGKTLILQSPDGDAGAAAFVTDAGQGFYVADDFTLAEAQDVLNVEFLGYQVADDLLDRCSGVQIFFYEDDGGFPSGIPGHAGQPVFSLDLDASDPKLYLERVDEEIYDFLIDTTGFHAEANKKYWVVFAPKTKLNGNEDYEGMWNDIFSTKNSGSDAAAVDPDDYMGAGLTKWYSLYDLYGQQLGDETKAICFALYDENFLATKDAALEKTVSLYPNPAVNSITINSKDFVKADIIDFSGRFIKSSAAANIDVSGLAKGAYNVKVSLKNGKTVVKKLIKQ